MGIYSLQLTGKEVITMPRNDGSGPMGGGPRTGWGRGSCGPGYAHGWFANGCCCTEEPSTEEKLEMLDEKEAMLKEHLTHIEKMRASLKAKK